MFKQVGLRLRRRGSLGGFFELGESKLRCGTGVRCGDGRIIWQMRQIALHRHPAWKAAPVRRGPKFGDGRQ